jgi:endonuclease YncB( thermonuclease family)
MKFVLRSFVSAIALLMIVSATGFASAETIVGIASVIDADTIEIHGTRIRLYGIDAPEGRQECTRPDGAKWRCGQQGSLALANLIGRASIRCEARDHDQYGRTVAVCFKGAEDINRWLVRSGWAVAYRQYSNAYVADEATARNARANIWSGAFEMPWDWRAHGRTK